MYFASRVQAGRMLASRLKPKYRYENCAVVALNDGGVMVGAQVAIALHASLSLLLTAEIKLPQEPEALMAISQNGSFSFNKKYSSGEIDDMVGEYYHYIEQEKMTKLQEMGRAGKGGQLIRKEMLKGRNIILVSDGLKDSFSLDVALEYLKPISTEKIIVATPLASVDAVDRMHILADKIYCLSVVPDYITTEHYYDKQDVPSHEKAIEIVEQIILRWK